MCAREREREKVGYLSVYEEIIIMEELKRKQEEKREKRPWVRIFDEMKKKKKRNRGNEARERD